MNWAPVIDEFKRCHVLVVGDICLDRWCRYDPATRDPSRETGIPRIGIVRLPSHAGRRRHGREQPGRLGRRARSPSLAPSARTVSVLSSSGLWRGARSTTDSW